MILILREYNPYINNILILFNSNKLQIVCLMTDDNVVVDDDYDGLTFNLITANTVAFFIYWPSFVASFVA